jgi:hypothetical protein
VKNVELKAGKECEKALYCTFKPRLRARPRDKDVVLNSLQTYLMRAAERNVLSCTTQYAETTRLKIDASERK